MLRRTSDGGGTFQNESGVASQRSPSLHVDKDGASYIDAPMDYRTGELEAVFDEARALGWVPEEPEYCDGDCLDDDMVRIWLVPAELVREAAR
ncbi:hypothetical protein GCM10010124_02350 [Pilimelia terevasa]|uniref:Uncharacterized protein n=1 Tax=Pilimelia terevasa TaxID=53372 RepID=A0A8J3BDC4_9ACTN|nr:hypothetical protein GCM10010124_02350 [Pilimelia terevasa]